MKDNKIFHTSNIVPLLLSGGYGKRLWPLSRQSYPKQFSELVGKKSLFQETVLRFISSKIISFNKHITITNANFRFIITDQLQEINVEPGTILIEPESKNTGPAILAAIIYAIKENPNAILIVSPTDHLIPNTEAFHEALSLGLAEVNKGMIVTFGIKPTHAETGYGYLQVARVNNRVPVLVKRFAEKPNLENAKKMFESENYLWNAGIFMFRAIDMLKAYQTHSKNMVNIVKNSIEKGKPDLSFFKLDPSNWAKCENISIDYAIMEKTKNLVAVPFLDGWSDLGDWESIWSKQNFDNKNGLVVSNNATAIDCKNTLLRSESNKQHIVGLGLNEIIAIAMPDAVLIADKNRSQDIKDVVTILENKGVNQALNLPKDHRPWGWFESLILENNFQVKKIMVKSGGILSLQSHKYRSEHWIVVKGRAKVTIDGEIKTIYQGESIYIPLGSVHRLENETNKPIIIIEIQSGSYLGEDDIIRYEDIYKRT